VTGAPPDLMFSMILATGVLIGTVVVLVIVAFAWYRKAEKKRLG
jgi:ABC-type glycerol-3-phosphate transport system permease component